MASCLFWCTSRHYCRTTIFHSQYTHTYILYINDLPSSPCSSQPFQFADCIKCCKKGSFLCLNAASFTFITELILHSLSCHLDSVPIPLSTKCKDLGIPFSSDLSWSQCNMPSQSETIKSLHWFDKVLNATH